MNDQVREIFDAISVMKCEDPDIALEKLVDQHNQLYLDENGNFTPKLAFLELIVAEDVIPKYETCYVLREDLVMYGMPYVLVWYPAIHDIAKVPKDRIHYNMN